MRIDSFNLDRWMELNHEIQQRLGIHQPRVQCRLSRGVVHSLVEAVMGLTEIFPHRKSVAIFQHASPWFAPIENLLSREAYQLQTHPMGEDSSEFVAGLDKATLIALVPEDHAITGEVYDNSELVSQLVSKRVFVIRVSHHKHRFERFTSFARGELSPFECRVLSLSSEFSVALLGPRCRYNSSISPHLYWSDRSLSKLDHGSEFEDAVLSFEREFSEFRFLETSERVYDRALLRFRAVSGEYVQQYLTKELELKIDRPGAAVGVETTNLCRWGGLDHWKWSNIPDEDLSSLVIFDPRAIEREDFRSAVRSLIEKSR